MIDRVPRYPGRVKMTPVSGQPNIYDMERADQPIQEGTKLNKASLASDQMLAKFGLTGESATPNGVLDWLGNFNLHTWVRRRRDKHVVYKPFSNVHEIYYLSLTNTKTSAGEFAKFKYSDGIIQNADDTFSLAPPVSEYTVVRYSGPDLNFIKGKYVLSNCMKDPPFSSIPSFSGPVLAPENANIRLGDKTFSGNKRYYHGVENAKYPVVEEYTTNETELVTSMDRNAYPDSGILDGYEYGYIGIPFDRLRLGGLRVSAFSYIGTGTTNPSVFFNYKPKLVLIVKDEGYNGHGASSPVFFGGPTIPDDAEPPFGNQSAYGETSSTPIGTSPNDQLEVRWNPVESGGWEVSWSDPGRRVLYNSENKKYNVLCIDWQEVNN